MLMPKRVKYRRVQRGRLTGKAMRGNTLSNGTYGLVALEPAWITSNQIEAARIAMTRYIKRGGEVWIKIFPDKPITEKPAETRMGSGKGSPEYWVAVVKPGRIMFEMAGVSEEVAREAMRLAGHKLPIKTKFIKKEENGEGEAMKAAELNKLSVEELNAKLKELKGELFNLRFQHAVNQLENPHKIVDVKKDIARVMTVLNQKNA